MLKTCHSIIWDDIKMEAQMASDVHYLIWTVIVWWFFLGLGYFDSLVVFFNTSKCVISLSLPS